MSEFKSKNEESEEPEWVAKELEKPYPLDAAMLMELRKDSIVNNFGLRRLAVAHYRNKIRNNIQYRERGVFFLYASIFAIGWFYGFGLAALVLISNVAHGVARNSPEVQKDYFRRMDLKAQNPERYKDI